MTVIEQVPETPVAPSEVTAADVLNRAADLLEEFEWRQYDRGSRARDRMCAIGALSEARRDYGETVVLGDFYHLPYDLHDALVAAGIAEGGLGLWGFNDAPGRTKAEVVAKLREAAKAAS